jgi:ABC-2 type transport system permease protein
MRGLFAIWRRELAALFLGPLAWTLLFLALLLGGSLFASQLAASGGDVDVAIRYALVVSFYVGVVAAPLVTMRMISEESKAGLLEYLLTAPVTDAAVVTGKFLAATSFFAILSGSVFVYSVALAALGVAPDTGTVTTGWIGLVLSSGLMCAIGMLTSSLTSTPIVAAFAAVVLDLVLVFAPQVARLSDVPWVVDAAARLDVTEHLSASFLRGAIDSAHVVFFVTWTALLLFLAVRAVESRRWR